MNVRAEATKLQIHQRLKGTIAESILSHESGMNLMPNNPDGTLDADARPYPNLPCIPSRTGTENRRLSHPWST